MNSNLIVLGLVGVGIKLLLIPSYFSTDFDVHHNWLRITSSKPLNQWYFDDQNKWTLDYPPFFAYFEYLLALIAQYIDPNILLLNVTQKVIYYQRISVILTQIPFLYVLYVIFNRKITFQLIYSYLFIPFILLDNIHFQYNIMLQTIFLISLYYLIRKQNYLIAAVTYSILLNFKHIYLYCSIAYFLIILKKYVCDHNQFKVKFIRLAKVGVITLIPFAISFLPFVLTGGIDTITQIFSRLFPFARGLIHDYWAPNFWALYYFTDKILFFTIKKIFASPDFNIITNTIQNTNKSLNYLRILPQPSANMTLLIILLCLIPLILWIVRAKNISILRIIIINGLVFFMFGYHVHQKAITPYLHLLYVFSMSKSLDKNNYNQISQSEMGQQNNGYKSQINSKATTVRQNNKIVSKQQVYGLIFFNIFNLFPLLIDVEQKPLKILITIFNFILVTSSLTQNKKQNNPILYLCHSCVGLVIVCQVLIPLYNWVNGNKLQFLPLMINSVFTATINLIWVIKLYYQTIKN